MKSLLADLAIESLNGNSINSSDSDSAPDHPTLTPAADDGKPKKGIRVGKRSITDLNDETKILRIWLIGSIYNVNDYIHMITLLYQISNEYTVYMYINSPGGSITTASHIINAMERCRANVITFNVGIAASCGSLIMSFGDRIHVDENTTTMFHNAACGNFDSAHRLLNQTNHIINSASQLFDKMRQRGIITEDELTGIVANGEEFYIDSGEMTKRLKANNIWHEEK